MDRAQTIKDGIKTAVCSSGGGHAGGSLSAADILACLYDRVMRYDVANPGWDGRDRLILSKGHAGIALYAALAASGFIPLEELEQFGSAGNRLMNHPDAHRIPGVEMCTGSLGHGLSLTVGIALAGQMKKQDYFVYCILGDGECCEGSVWEAAMYACTQRLKRLVVIIDQNGLGCDGALEQIIQLAPFADKWTSFGFTAVEVDGHDTEAMNRLFLQLCSEADGPYAVIAHTVKGKGLADDIAGTGASHYLSGTAEVLKQRFTF